MNYNIWRFPSNNFTSESGLNNSDMETFKKDPMASLAREICQNSLDARREECNKAIVEFEVFTINNTDIPGYSRLKEEIESCHDYRKHPNDKAELAGMLNSINNEKIKCLRISDKNTTGLGDVFGSTEDSKFYLLTKGSGLTSKIGGKGGSKGVGKFACFVASSFNTVFYSTKNEAGEEGFLGISKLCSTIYKDSPEQRTVGIGYYSSDERNLPIAGQLNLQPNYIRTEYGTDIYILGFKGVDDWKKKIITMILDSFMVAIMFDELEVRVDDILLNKKTVGKLISKDYITTNKQLINIKAQYELLTGDDVYSENIKLDDFGEIKVLLKAYKKETAEEATKNCIMVRYPHMKIRTLRKISSVPCSALCIIEDSDFNNRLINVENPQHTDWETNRLSGTLKAEMDYQINTMEDSILNYVADTLSMGIEEESDIEGAGEFLPSANNDGDFGENKPTIIEKPIVIPKTRVRIKDTNPTTSADDGSEADIPDVGDLDDNGNDTSKPEGHNQGHGGGVHETEEKTGHKEGDQEILRTAPLKGMKYIPFIPNKASGELIIAFKSLYDEKDCQLMLSYKDESNQKYKVNVSYATINEIPVNVNDGNIEGFNLETGKEYTVKAQTDVYDYYRIEVTIYANKK